MHTMPSGHANVSITEFGKDGWKLPIEASHAGLREEDFHSSPLNGAAMFGASFQEGAGSPRNSKSPFPHDVRCSAPAPESEDESMGHFVVGSTNALLLWRLLGSRVLKIVKAKQAAEERAEDLPCVGYAAGSWQHPVYPPPEHTTYLEDTAYTVSQAPLDRHEEYARQIQQGVYAGRRKCAKKPNKEVEECVHPLKSLAGGGNAYGKDVWCQERHTRWKVSTTVPNNQKGMNTKRSTAASSGSGSVKESVKAQECVAGASYLPSDSWSRRRDQQRGCTFIGAPDKHARCLFGKRI